MNEKIAQKYAIKAVMYKKWMHIWLQFKKQIMDMPMWTQEALLEDVKTTIQTQASVIQKAKTGKEKKYSLTAANHSLGYPRTSEQPKPLN